MKARGGYKKYLRKDGNNTPIPRSSRYFYDNDCENDDSKVRKRFRRGPIHDDNADLMNCHEDESAINPSASGHQLESSPGRSSDAESDLGQSSDYETYGCVSTSPKSSERLGDGSVNDASERDGHVGVELCPEKENADALIDATSQLNDDSEPISRVEPNPFMRVDDLTAVRLFHEINTDHSVNSQQEPSLVDETLPLSEGVGDGTEAVLTIDEYTAGDDTCTEPGSVDADQRPGLETEETGEGTIKLSHHNELWKALSSETFTSPIATPVNASPAEALLMCLSIAEQNNLSFKAFTDTVKLTNSLFSSPVLAESQHLLDKLLLSQSSLKRFFYCKKCTHSFGELDHEKVQRVVCPGKNCKTVNYIKDLTQATYFVLYPVEHQIQLLLMKDKIKKNIGNPKDLVAESHDDVFKDIYNGQCYKKFVRLIEKLVTDLHHMIMSFTICTDGSPLFKSSPFSIWPVFLCINELPPSLRMKNLLLVGLWFGPKHPPMDLFLEPVVKHLQSLSNPGFKVQIDNEEIEIKAYTINCCVDSGARGAVQGINSHSGYFSCNWCEIPGEYVEHRVVFPFEENPSQLRAHERLIDQAKQCMRDDKLLYVYGAQFASPLAKLPGFDIVDGMVQDFLHNIPFGIGRVFMEHWLTNTSKKGSYIGCPKKLATLKAKMKQITPCIEVRRAIRSLDVYAYWNAREYENWIIFYSIPTLSGVLKSKYLTHWKCFVQGVFLLSRQSVPKSDISIAHKLLVYFVLNVERLYGKKFMTFNVHILLHLAQNVARWGPTWAVSTYCFEAAIGSLKRLLHAQRGVPHQVERAISYREAKGILLDKCNSPKVELFLQGIVSKPNKMTMYLPLKDCVAIGKLGSFCPNCEEKFLVTQLGIDISNCAAVSKIIASRCVYTTEELAVGKQFNNSCALLVSGNVVLIKKFIVCKSTEEVYFFCNSVHLEPFLKFPSHVRIVPQDHCIRKVVSVGRRLILKSVRDLEIVCLTMSIDGDRFISRMHNLYNIC